MQLFPVGKVYDFMGQRRLCAVVSFVLVIGSIFMLFKPGPRLGTDFKGGTEIEVAFKKPVQDEQIRTAVEKAGFSSPDVIRINDAAKENQFLVRVQEVSSIGDEEKREIERALCFGDNLDPAVCPEASQAAEVKFSPGGDKITVRYREKPDLAKIKTTMSQLGSVSLRDTEENPRVQNERDNKVEVLLKSKGAQLMDGLRTALGDELVPDAAERVEWIGPKAGAQLRDSALKSIAIALIFVMVYIAVRFDLRFAPGAVVALAHDAIATIGVLIVIDKELNLSTVAAVLTIVGYSVNDTVVVYDRVRENLGQLRGSSFMKIINVSLSEMLSRTVLTSGTTIFSLTAFFYWGTGTLKDFALTIIIGLILGTYSSIYVALPLTEWLDRRLFGHVDASASRKKRRAAPRKKETAVV